MADKVLFGFSDLYIGTYTDNAGTVTLGTPVRVPGAVSYAADPQGDNYTFYADNIAYYSNYTSGTYEGDLTVAMFDETFRTTFLGQITLADGGVAEVKNASKPNIYMMFQVKGDEKGRRVIFYNGTLGNVTREYSTIEESIEVATESVPVTFVGDATTGITKVTYKDGDAGYSTLFTNPPVPALPTP